MYFILVGRNSIVYVAVHLGAPADDGADTWVLGRPPLPALVTDATPRVLAIDYSDPGTALPDPVPIEFVEVPASFIEECTFATMPLLVNILNFRVLQFCRSRSMLWPLGLRSRLSGSP